MSEPFYVSRSSVRRVAAVRRRADIEAAGPVEFRIHGPVKSSNGLTDAENLPLPVDFLVASAGT